MTDFRHKGQSGAGGVLGAALNNAMIKSLPGFNCGGICAFPYFEHRRSPELSGEGGPVPAIGIQYAQAALAIDHYGHIAAVSLGVYGGVQYLFRLFK